MKRVNWEGIQVSNQVWWGIKVVVVLAILAIWGVFGFNIVFAGRIDLTTPEVRPDITRAVVVDASDHPEQEALSFRVVLQYEEAGEWKQGGDFARVVANTDAIPDDPLTPEDEFVPASTAYTTLTGLVSAGGKSIQQIILERVEARTAFDGVISGTAGNMILTLTTPRTRPDATRLVIRRISDNPRASKLVLVGVIQYQQGGNWLNHRRIRNVIEDETSTAYTDFMTTHEVGGKTLARSAMDNLVLDYPGTIVE